MNSHKPRQTQVRDANALAQPPDCLVRHVPTETKGCTILARDVHAVDLHRRRLAERDGYRPSSCSHCGHDRLHVHDYRHRVLRANRDVPEISIVRYRCASCHAIFRILPAFVARYLWRSMHTIAEETLDTCPSPTRPPVPGRTIHRWQTRLEATLGPLHEAFRKAEHPLASMVHCDEPRKAIVDAHANLYHQSVGTSLLDVATLVHEIDPSQRLI